MSKLELKGRPQLKNNRVSQFIACLADMRTPEGCDVILLCKGQELFAHKLVLNTCGPYFVSLFQSKTDEVKSGRIEFQDIEPNILDIILNYIYTGEILVKSDDEIHKVLAASHSMQLEELHQCCCEALCGVIKTETLIELWETATTYESPLLRKCILEFCLDNCSHLHSLDTLISCDVQMLKDILKFTKEKQSCQDKLLDVILKWLCFKFKARKVLVGELFNSFDPNLVSEDCLRNLLQNKEVMLRPEAAAEVNALSVLVLLSSTEKRQRKEQFQFHVTNISELQGSRYSLSKTIQNMTWQIKVKVNENDVKKTVGVYIECSSNSASSTWSCPAVIDFFLLKQVKEENDYFSRRLRHTFRPAEETCGFDRFLPWTVIVNPTCGFLNNDAITIVVHITADTASDTEE